MGSLTVIGVDPGGTTGIAALRYADGALIDVDLLQVTPGAVLWVVESLLSMETAPRLLAIEEFVVGPRAAKSSAHPAGKKTRELIGALGVLAGGLGVSRVVRPAATVKPWATDERIRASKLSMAGMGHAIDAARHALYAAVRDAGIPDPLSRTVRGA